MPSEWLDMNVDVNRTVAEFANSLFEFGGLAVGIAQTEIFVNFEMQFDEELPLLLQGAEVVYTEAHSLGDGADGFKQVFALRRARLGMNHYVRRNDFAYAFFDGIA